MKSCILSFKKGSFILEIIYFMVVVIIFIIAGLALHDTNEELEDIVTEDTLLSAEHIAMTTRQTDSYSSRIDNFLVILLVVMWLGMLGVSFLTDAHPFFYVIGFLGLVILLGTIVVLGNATEEIATDDYSTIIASYPNMNFIASHILETVIVIAGSVGVVLYGRQAIF